MVGYTLVCLPDLLAVERVQFCLCGHPQTCHSCPNSNEGWRVVRTSQPWSRIEYTLPFKFCMSFPLEWRICSSQIGNGSYKVPQLSFAASAHRQWGLRWSKASVQQRKSWKVEPITFGTPAVCFPAESQGLNPSFFLFCTLDRAVKSANMRERWRIHPSPSVTVQKAFWYIHPMLTKAKANLKAQKKRELWCIS